jgi:hypothetical protein
MQIKVCVLRVPALAGYEVLETIDAGADRVAAARLFEAECSRRFWSDKSRFMALCDDRGMVVAHNGPQEHAPIPPTPEPVGRPGEAFAPTPRAVPGAPGRPASRGTATSGVSGSARLSELVRAHLESRVVSESKADALACRRMLKYWNEATRGGNPGRLELVARPGPKPREAYVWIRRSDRTLLPGTPRLVIEMSPRLADVVRRAVEPLAPDPRAFPAPPKPTADGPARRPRFPRPVETRLLRPAP